MIRDASVQLIKYEAIRNGSPVAVSNVFYELFKGRGDRLVKAVGDGQAHRNMSHLRVWLKVSASTSIQQDT
jgi:hypothetical protein